MSDMLARLRATYTEEHDKAARLVDAAKAEHRDLNESEASAFEDSTKEIRDLSKRIALMEEHESRDRELHSLRSRQDKSGADSFYASGARGEFGDPLDGETRDFFAGRTNVLDVNFRGLTRSIDSTGKVEVRSGVLEGGAGASLVPISFRTVLYQHLIQHSAIRQTRATILTTQSGEPLLVPKTTAHPVAGTIVSEAAAIGEADPSFGQGTLNAYKFANLIQVSNEMESDTGVDLLGYLARIMGQRLADGSGQAFITGAGTSGPQGALIGCGTICQVTGGTGQAGIPTYVELENVFDGVIPAYQANGEWLLSQSTLSKLRQIKDGNSRPLFYSGLEGFAGALPNTIFGRQFFVDPYMPTAGTAGTSILFGDFASYFIREAGLRIERSIDYAFGNDLITYRAVERCDGRLMDLTGALSTYKGGAS